MYITVSGRGKAKVIQLVEQHRDKESGKKRTKVLKTYGNYERMLAEDPDILVKLKAEAKEMTKAQKEGRAPQKIEVFRKTIRGTDDMFKSLKFGHCVIQQVWQNLKLPQFFERNLKDQPRSQESQQAIFALVCHRIMKRTSLVTVGLDLSNYAGLGQVQPDQELACLDNVFDSLLEHLTQKFIQQQEVANLEPYLYLLEAGDEAVSLAAVIFDSNGLPWIEQVLVSEDSLTAYVNNLKDTYQLDELHVAAARPWKEVASLTKSSCPTKEQAPMGKFREIEEFFYPTDWSVFSGEASSGRQSFALDCLAYSLLSYLQFLLRTRDQRNLSLDSISQALASPFALVYQEAGQYKLIVSNVSDDFISLMEAVGLANLFTVMTPSEFEHLTKLSLHEGQL